MTAGDLFVNFERTEDTQSSIRVSSKELDLTFEANFDGSHESNFWVTPLSEDKSTNFYTWKRAGIPLQPF